jgi:hypothetical protein
MTNQETEVPVRFFYLHSLINPFPSMKSHIHSIIIAIATVLSALLLSNSIMNRNRGNDSISVTGMGSRNFTSDLIVWSGTFGKKSEDLKAAYAGLDSDREKIRAYLTGKGIPQNNLVFSAVEISREFDDIYDGSGMKTKSTFTGYRLTQSVQIESGEVDKIENISREVSELINAGVEFYSNQPQYYYTKLADLKIEMIAQATRDARERARKMAENAGSDLGVLKNANMGVFQITAQNSSEDFSWGGSFNTTSKRKTATITVKLEFQTR